MKCTLISGPAGSGKKALSGWIMKPFSDDEICCFPSALSWPDDFTEFSKAVQAGLKPRNRIILVNEVQNLLQLKNWVQLSSHDSLLTAWPMHPVKVIRPEFVLLFQTISSISGHIPKAQLRSVKVVDLTKDTFSQMAGS